MTVRKDICGECPFRRESAGGWLGRNEPVAFANQAVYNEGSVACHLQVDQTLPRPEWEEAEMNAPRCRGALVLMRNMGKLPRDREMATLVRTVAADRQTVFERPAEFVTHHIGAATKSWEF